MLDAIIGRLQNLHPFNIYEIDPITGDIKPWYSVVAPTVLPELVIQENNLTEQIQVVSAQIAHWGRLTAQAKRIWAIAERKYRIWRDTQQLLIINTPDDKKKPTQATIDATIRTMPEYSVHYQNIERAEEAYNAANAILDGFRAKKEMMKLAIRRDQETGAAQLTA